MKPTPMPTPAVPDLKIGENLGKGLGMIPLQMWLWLGAIFAVAFLGLFLKAKIERAQRRAQIVEDEKLRLQVREDEAKRRDAA